jgi:hydrogenase maturation protease
MANMPPVQFETPRRPFLVLGAGNLLMSDEGVGVRVLEFLQKQSLPACADLVDAGTAMIELLPLLSARDTVIIIDAVKCGNLPGTICRFSPEDISILKQPNVSLHEIGILESLQMAELAGWKPRRTIIFGVEPEHVGWGIGLSAPVAASVPKVGQLIIEEICSPTAKQV